MACPCHLFGKPGGEVEAVRDDVIQRSEARRVTHGHVTDSRGRDPC